ncbi:sensor domain-containing protein [Larsenimonas suaedae]|uniref:EAL domain-containing protein n=1 Tax=Larsenimonas suaedae TaxID=1851019 RepID=A0ABU1GRW9_9GAMM|nr:EAL domain-containing protein [Larsenimonas suaedae]MCM2972438.1 EAL domain-containing protein [Larsenimonas suaedae]MDR5894766.1 EAL domain-containing protein [Larsenimonas suaedae]
MSNDPIYRYLVHNVIDYAIYLLDLDGNVMSWNEGARLIKGYTPEEIIGRHFSCFYTDADRQAGLPALGLQRAREEGRFESEGWRIRKDGTLFWSSVVIDPVHDDSGTLIGFAKVARDNTETMQQRRRQLEEEHRFRLLVEGVSDYAIYMLSPDGVITNWNAGAQHIKGYIAEDVIGKHFSMFYTDQDRTDNKPEKSLDIAREQGSFEAEGWRVRKDGSTFMAHVVIEAIRDDLDTLIGFAKITRDVTERREYEKALQVARDDVIARNEELDALSTFLNSVIANIPIHVVVQEVDTGRIRLNSETLRDAQGGKSSVTAPHHLAEILDQLTGTSERAILERTLQQTHAKLQRADGTRHLRCRMVPLVAENEQLLMVYLIEDVTETKQAHDQIHHMAHHDALTNLPNRSLFVRCIEQGLELCRERRQSTGVLMLDLDNFKDVNDVLGHHVGDQLLMALAARLQPLLSDHDIMARIGGDEFAIVVPACHTIDALEALATRLLSAVQAPFEIDHHQLQAGISVGIALSSETLDTPEALMKSADLALYEAKRVGKGAYACYNDALHQAACARLDMEADLRRALRENEFVVFYQPIMRADDYGPSGYEALIRWMHPMRGMVSPLEFISVAERTGLIHDIGLWVLNQACREAASWQTEMTVSVNLSPIQFERPQLVDDVQQALVTSRLAPERLELEITESILLDSSQRNMTTLKALKALGVAIALDDFGTGYSSLHYLRSFPFDRIKIDRSFVDEICQSNEARAIIKAITSLGNSLDIKITAEGVEHLDQAEALQHEGCSHLQGYYFGRPAELVSEALTAGSAQPVRE